MYVIPEVIALTKCNSLRYKGGLPVARWGGCPGPLKKVLRGQLEGGGKGSLLPGQVGEGSQKSKEFGRFPSGDLESRKAQAGYWCTQNFRMNT
jgi:hypothetical protein